MGTRSAEINRGLMPGLRDPLRDPQRKILDMEERKLAFIDYSILVNNSADVAVLPAVSTESSDRQNNVMQIRKRTIDRNKSILHAHREATAGIVAATKATIALMDYVNATSE